MEPDEAMLLALLNSTPVVDGVPADELGGDESAQAWLRASAIPVPFCDRRILQEGRDVLQAVVRGEQPPKALGVLLDGVVHRPAFAGEQLIWTLELADATALTGARAVLARAVLSWDALRVTRPGRLRPCGNPECALFLVDRSKSNTARWCSMATCGNKLKARRHHQRARQNP